MKTLIFSILVPLAVISGSIRAADIAVSDDGSKSEQSHPRIAVSANAGFVVVWEDKRGGMPDVYYQRFDKYGYSVGLNKRITDDSSVTVRKQPALAIDYSGRYQLSWLDYRTGAYPLGPQIFGQRFDSLGNWSGVNTRLTTEPPDSLRAAPDVVLAPNGDGMIVWEDYRNRNWDIYAQRFSSAGALIGANFKINDDVNNAQQHSPRIAVSGEGWYVMTWCDNRWGNDDIFIQRLDSAGTRIGQNLKVNSDAGSSRQAFPDVATDGAGHFTVVWTDWRNGTYPNNPDIYARRFDTLLTALNTDTKVNRDGSLRAQKDPAIAADRLGNVAIVWSDSGTASFDIGGQMIDVDGTVRETSFHANTSTDSAQMQPDVALDGRNRYVCWADNRNGNWDIYASITKYNTPALVAAPTTFSFAMSVGGSLPASQSLVLKHTGYNRLKFRAKTSAAWLTVTPDTGTTVDTITVAVSANALAAGTYFSSITLVDVTDGDSSVSLPVVLVCTDPQDDTLRIGSGQVVVGQSTGISLTAINADSLASIQFALKAVDTGLVTFDSLEADSMLPVGSTVSMTVDTMTGYASITASFDSAGFLEPGSRQLGRLWLTGLATGYTPLDSVSTAVFTTKGGLSRTPVFQSGDIQVDAITAVGDPTEPSLPQVFSLAQNYPNPFNGSTVISFDVPSAGQVNIEMFNILGQRVATLLDRKVPVGTQQVHWDGLSDRGNPLPSGVYFYRLRTASVSLVRKLVLLK